MQTVYSRIRPTLATLHDGGLLPGEHGFDGEHLIMSDGTQAWGADLHGKCACPAVQARAGEAAADREPLHDREAELLAAGLPLAPLPHELPWTRVCLACGAWLCEECCPDADGAACPQCGLSAVQDTRALPRPAHAVHADRRGF